MDYQIENNVDPGGIYRYNSFSYSEFGKLVEIRRGK